VSATRNRNAHTVLWAIISSAGTESSAFQYAGVNPHMKNAPAEYKTPAMDRLRSFKRESGSDFIIRLFGRLEQDI
jgi:hypothetical protein